MAHSPDTDQASPRRDTPLDALLRIELGPLSDRELERRGVVARMTLRALRRGHRPRPIVARRIADALHVPQEVIAAAIELTLARGRS